MALNNASEQWREIAKSRFKQAIMTPSKCTLIESSYLDELAAVPDNLQIWSCAVVLLCCCVVMGFVGEPSCSKTVALWIYATRASRQGRLLQHYPVEGYTQDKQLTWIIGVRCFPRTSCTLNACVRIEIRRSLQCLEGGGGR